MVQLCSSRRGYMVLLSNIPFHIYTVCVCVMFGRRTKRACPLYFIMMITIDARAFAFGLLEYRFSDRMVFLASFAHISAFKEFTFTLWYTFVYICMYTWINKITTKTASHRRMNDDDNTTKTDRMTYAWWNSAPHTVFDRLALSGTLLSKLRL